MPDRAVSAVDHVGEFIRPVGKIRLEVESFDSADIVDAFNMIGIVANTIVDQDGVQSDATHHDIVRGDLIVGDKLGQLAFEDVQQWILIAPEILLDRTLHDRLLLNGQQFSDDASDDVRRVFHLQVVRQCLQEQNRHGDERVTRTLADHVDEIQRRDVHRFAFGRT